MNRILQTVSYAWLLSCISCKLYTPLQPVAPLISRKGQVEASGGVRLTLHSEASVAYSPVAHVLVRGALGGLSYTSTDTTRFRTHQYELAAGTYWLVGKNWLLGGTGGYGEGKASHWYRQTEGFLGIGGGYSRTPESYRYDARYNRIFGEVYAHYFASPRVSVGAAYRLNKIQFITFTNRNIPTGFREMTRSEPLIFVRMGQREGRGSWVAAQLSVGASSVPGYREPESSKFGNRDAVEPKQPAVFTTLSLIIRPSYLWQNAQ